MSNFTNYGTPVNFKWKTDVDCFRAAIPISLPPGDGFIYTTINNMATYNSTPHATAWGGWNEDCFSHDVIVCGNEAKKVYILVGALTCRRSYTFLTARYRDRRLVEVEVQQPYIKKGEEPEDVVMLEGNDWRELLCHYADLAASAMNVKPIAAEKNMTGYCTWYYYYKDVTQAHLLENVEALAKNRSVFAAEYVQIDDGYQTLQGDWLDRHENWPVPLDVTAEKITDSGMKAGIWIMPFVASTSSKVFQKHPDWFVKDEHGEILTHTGWTPPPDHLWACLDTTQDEVCEHLVHIFKTFREMGYRYIKMDGLNYGLFEGVRSDRNATPISAYRKGLQVIRDAVPDCLLMACTAPFMASMGLVDNIRVSNDTSRDYMTGEKTRNHPFFSCSIAAAVRLSLSHFWKFDRWFRCDPDALMARQDNAFYTRGEAKMSILSGILTGISITSDNLATIAPDRLALLGKAQDLRMRNARPVLKQGTFLEWPSVFEGTIDGVRAVAVMNETSSPVKYFFSELGLPEECIDLLEDKNYTHEIELAPHDAVLLR